MKNLNELSLFVVNSAGSYCLLTFPYLLNFIKYPSWLFIAIGIVSVITGSLISNWELKKINKKNGTEK